MSGYATGTEVSVERSEAEIRSLLRRYGASEFVLGERPREALLGFRANNRNIRFVLPLPAPGDKEFAPTRRTQRGERAYRESHCAAEHRRRWRSLGLVIKAKLEAVASGITTFEDEFLAHIVLPGGQTVSEIVRPAIADAYDKGYVVPLLPAWGGAGA